MHKYHRTQIFKLSIKKCLKFQQTSAWKQNIESCSRIANLYFEKACFLILPRSYLPYNYPYCLCILFSGVFYMLLSPLHLSKRKYQNNQLSAEWEKLNFNLTKNHSISKSQSQSKLKQNWQVNRLISAFNHRYSRK